MSSEEAIPRDSTGAPQRIEVITGHERRRHYSDEDKARLVAEAAEPGQSVHGVARRHGVCSSLLYRWRRDGAVEIVACPVKTGPFLKRALEGEWNGARHGTSVIYG